MTVGSKPWEVKCRPRHSLRIVRNGRQCLVGKFLRVDEAAVFQSMTDGYDQLSAVYQQAVTGDDVIVTQWEATEGGVDPAVGNRLKLVNERKLHPIQGHAVKHLLQLRHQREGQLIEAASQEADSEDRRLSSSLMLTLLKRLS